MPQGIHLSGETEDGHPHRESASAILCKRPLEQDVRTPAEFDQLHASVPLVANIPAFTKNDQGVMEPLPDFVDQVGKRFKPADKILVGESCACSVQYAPWKKKTDWTRTHSMCGWEAIRGSKRADGQGGLQPLQKRRRRLQRLGGCRPAYHL